MRPFILFLITVSSSLPLFAQQGVSQLLLDSGIARHDKQDYEGAIKIYDQIISTDKDFYGAYYEKSFSLVSMGKYQDCIDLCKQILMKFKKEDGNKNVYVNYGTALDALKESSDAIKIYKEGEKKFPDFYLLPFNKGITEYVTKDTEAATEDLEKSVSLNPVHASSHQFLAYCVYGKNKIASVMSLSTFLLLETAGERTTKNLKILLKVLGSNVEQKDSKTVNISLSPDALKESGEDDFHLTELTLTLQTSLDYSEEYKDLRPEQKLMNKLSLLAGISSSKKGFFTKFYVPFFAEMKEEDFLETASYIIYASNEEAGNKKWIDDNMGKVKEFYQWMNDYKWNKEL
jgi:tetratricopeptide (TPR) repeat protein